MYPSVLVRSGPHDSIPVLAGVDSVGQMVGYDLVNDDIVEGADVSDVVGVVSLYPAAVFYGVEAERVEQPPAAVANRRRRYQPRGQLFTFLPEGELSGFPAAERVLRRHRMVIPSLDTIRVSALFAVNTIRTKISTAEAQFDCVGTLYEEHGREMPPIEDLRKCFKGLQNSKSETFQKVADYAPTIRDAIAHGYRDRELRHILATDTDTPDGLGLSKLSFTLALLGNDTVCIDARLLKRMFPNESDREHFQRIIGKRKGRISQNAIDAYESLEDAFLKDNPHYDPNDPLGRARAQWKSWEATGGRGAEHQTWMRLLPAYQSN